MTHPLAAGDPAPNFTLPASRGGPASLGQYAGKTLILFFYPKDDTAVCTREAVEFSSAQSRFTRKGAALLGVSRDTLEAHAAFIKKHKLKVRLASDEDGSACKAYGVWQQKQLYGRKFMGVVRSTFVIDPAGIILRVWRNVRVPGHVESILEFLSNAR